MSLSTYALTTLAKLKRALNIANTEYDTYLEECIDRATAIIHKHTRRNLLLQTYTAQVYDAPAGGVLWLPQYPIKTISLLTDDGSSVVAADYYLYSKTGAVELIDGNHWSGVQRGITITYAAGYDSSNTDHTYDLFQLDAVCLAVATRLYRASPISRQHYGQVEDLTDEPVYAEQALDGGLMYRLSPYVRTWIAAI